MAGNEALAVRGPHCWHNLRRLIFSYFVRGEVQFTRLPTGRRRGWKRAPGTVGCRRTQPGKQASHPRVDRMASLQERLGRSTE